LFGGRRIRVSALSVLERFGDLLELQQFTCEVQQVGLRVLRGAVEELSARIHAVHTTCVKPCVHLRLDPNSIVREEESVDVKAEWNGRIPQLPNTVQGFQAAGHADLDHAFAECTDVRDDVDVARLDVGSPVVDVCDVGVDLGQLLPDAGRPSLVAVIDQCL
jgi:hypothetical protein